MDKVIIGDFLGRMQSPIARQFEEQQRRYREANSELEICPNPVLEKDLEKRNGLEIAVAMQNRDFAEVGRIVGTYKDNPDAISKVVETAKYKVGETEFMIWATPVPSQNYTRVGIWERVTGPGTYGQWHIFQTNSTSEIKEK